MLLFLIVIICFIGYVFFERKFNSVDFLKEIVVEGMFWVGLILREKEFFFDGKFFWIFSGVIYYFRVILEYWKDRLLKFKVMGLNIVEMWVKFLFIFEFIYYGS